MPQLLLSMPGQPHDILQEVFRNLRRSIVFQGFTNVQTVIFKEFFLFVDFIFVTRIWENKSAPIELVTGSGIFYFLTSTQ